MYITNKTCSLICTPLHRLSPENLPQHRLHIGKLIEREIRSAVVEGFRTFRVGMNLGADIWAAQIVLLLREQFPALRLSLHCYLHCSCGANTWAQEWKEQYFDILAQANEVACLQKVYSRGSFERRDRRMIEGSRRLIAVHDNLSVGGIARAVRTAEYYGVETIVVAPFEGPDVPAYITQGAIPHHARSGRIIRNA